MRGNVAKCYAICEKIGGFFCITLLDMEHSSYGRSLSICPQAGLFKGPNRLGFPFGECNADNLSMSDQAAYI